MALNLSLSTKCLSVRGFVRRRQKLTCMLAATATASFFLQAHQILVKNKVIIRKGRKESHQSICGSESYRLKKLFIIEY